MVKNTIQKQQRVDNIQINITRNMFEKSNKNLCTKQKQFVGIRGEASKPI